MVWYSSFYTMIFSGEYLNALYNFIAMYFEPAKIK